MKRTFLVFLAALIAATAFVSCERGHGGPPGSTRVIFYTWDDTSIRHMVEAFNASQTEIWVDGRFLPAPDYEVQITTLLIGRAPMDAFMQKRQTDMFHHFHNGFIQPLDDLLLRTGVDRTAVDSYLHSVSIDGQVVGFPWRGAAYFTYYNRRIFEEMGVPTPGTFVDEGTWTWDMFEDVARQVSSGDGQIFGATVYHWGIKQLIPQIQNRRDVITANGVLDYDDSIHNWLSRRRRMEQENSMWPLIDMRVSGVHYSRQFFDGRVAMVIMGEWFPGMIMSGRDNGLLQGWGWEDWGLTRLPSDSDPYVTVGAPTFSHVAAHSRNQEAALRFIAWMGGPEGALIAAQAGVLPAMVDENVKQVLAESIPCPRSLDFFVEDRIVFPMTYNRFGSRVEALIGVIQDEYLLGLLSDDAFDARLRSGLEEIIRTTN
ncbi:MAG: extracellular solute-binding protein [Treponema sp.]|nr:extracellular solute-binding protein [Treponema sp.]